MSFDAGVDRVIRNPCHFDLTYFHNRFEDQIVTLGGAVQNLSSYTSDNLKNPGQGLKSLPGESHTVAGIGRGIHVPGYRGPALDGSSSPILPTKWPAVAASSA